MKTINSLRSKLLALTLALMASVASFAYDEMPDFQVDGLYYNFLEGDNVEVTHPYRLEMPTEGTSTTATQDLYDDYAELTDLTIPSTISYEGKVYNVIRIGYAAFDQCNLTYVDIPSSIKTIGVGAFSNCSSLTSITLKEGLEHIEGNAFADCRLLETITFPNSLKTVGSYAFSFTAWYNNQPNGGVYAGNVFYKYKGDIPENTSFVIKEGTVSISPDAFIKENRRIDYGLVAVAIPNSVEIIGEYAFSQCRALRSVNIPSRVTTIERYAFSYCKSLTSVTSEIVEPLSLPSDVFFKASVANATLYVPAESVDAYKNADQWKDFGQVLPIAENPEDLFPTLWGLQRTVCNEYCGKSEEDNSANVTYKHTFDYIRVTSEYKPYILCNGYSLREEDNKVLIYSHILNKDLVLYDFTLEVGDSLPALYIDYYPHSDVDLMAQNVVDYNKDGQNGTIYPADTFVVTDISSITLLDGNQYKKWTFDNGMEYVEGIGMYGGSRNGNFFGLIQKVVVPCHTGEHLVCASRNGKLLYQMDEAEMERLGAECLCDAENPKELFPTLWGLQRTSFYHYTECSDSYSSLTASNEIVTINDKPYLRFGKLFLREANNQVLIYSAAYDKDLVLYDWNLEVGDSISLLAMDYGVYPEYAVSVVDYRVIVDIDENGDLVMDTIPTDKVVVDEISTITLLDGKEYKTWHLATEWAGGITYVEGIGILSERYGGGDYFGLIRPEELPTCYYGDLLVCITRDNKLLYQMDDAEIERLGAECLCDYDRGPRKDNAKNGKIGGRPTPTQWNQLELDLREMENGNTILRAETFSYTLENDSIVANNKTFYQLARQSTKDTAITKSFVGALHFGEDEDNRVYFLRDGVEYVLYDFTAEPGDTIEIFAGINNYPQYTTYTHVVTGKDTLENGACRMMLEVVFPDETTTTTNAEKVWLAGLGSIDGIVHNAAHRTSDVHAAPSRSASSETQTSVMLCAWREDDCLYTTDHPDYDSYGCVYNLPTAVKNIDTHGTTTQKLIRNGQLLIFHEGKTYNVMGVEVRK